ncbi:MAG TPA: leucine--tRNA ligase [Phycisphaerales bacterium]|nr:leucine--tRNA ligase [Phycisphaerales bacterium]
MSQTPSANTPDRDSTPFRYTAQLADSIETRWQQRWAQQRTFVQPNPGEPGFDSSKPKFYCLDMFPYPSGAGLHVGHPEGYTATDIVCRYKRAKGFNVLHPMGWDAFGLPAEQYAIQTGVHPAITTRTAIDNFRRQLQRFGFSYDWTREFGTIDPGYYKWTQWIFLKLYDAWFDPRPLGSPLGGTGLRPVHGGSGRARPIADLIQELKSGSIPAQINPAADTKPIEPAPASWSAATPAQQRAIIDSYRLAYQGTTTVNWCPKLGTVLANDEVIDGKSERGGYPVLRKPLKQWMFRITAYADRLLTQLDALHWPESTKTQQREWIGRSEGAEVDFSLLGGPPLRGGSEHQSLVSTAASAAAARKLDPVGFKPEDPYPPGMYGAATELLKTQRNLPHLSLPEATYFVTWRAEAGVQLTPAERGVVLNALKHFDSDRCRSFAACIMHDHVHWIVKPLGDQRLDELVKSIKHFTAATINKSRGVKGHLWQDERFDHIIRDRASFNEYVEYTLMNPVEAGLAASPGEYAWNYVHADVGASAPAAERRTTQGGSLRVFTTRPDTLFGATYMVVAPEHPLVEAVLAAPGPRTDAGKVRAYVSAAKNKSDVERMESKQKTGVDLGIDAVNPATGEPIPVWVADYVLMGYGTGAIMAVPAHDDRDHEFAKAFNLPIVHVLVPAEGVEVDPEVCFAGDGVAVNSSRPDLTIDGMKTAEAKARMTEWLEASGLGSRKVNYKFRDWTFSRQRYWGEPFPIVFDAAGNHYPVGEGTLPVKLPELADYAPIESDDPLPLLAKAKDWVHTTAGAVGIDPSVLPPGTPVTRETNTMPGSAGSSWYALRYCDPGNGNAPVSREADAYWMKGGGKKLGGVDLYLGGSEHAVGHLLYARFWQNVLFDLGIVSTAEPFHKLFHQGLITSYAFQRADKAIIPTDEVKEVEEGRYVEAKTGSPVSPVVTKMSKRYKNVVNPDDVIAEYGADTFRLYEMSMGPLEASKPWNTKDIVGQYRFLQRVWRNVVDEQTGAVRLSDAAPSVELEKKLHRTTADVTEGIETLSLHTAISKLIELNNDLTKLAADGPIPRRAAETITLLLAPFAPHLAEELWAKLGHAGSVSAEPWPVYDPAMLVDDQIEIPIQVLGKLRGKMTVPAKADAKQIEDLARNDPNVQKHLEGKAIKKVIVVPGRMINFVVG